MNALAGTRQRGWPFIVAAAIPCALLLLFAAIGLHEWWLISSGQIVVAPMPQPGEASIPEVPASSLLPLILGSAALAGLFGWALLRGSRRALAGGYAFLLLIVAFGFARRLL